MRSSRMQGGRTSVAVPSTVGGPGMLAVMLAGMLAVMLARMLPVMLALMLAVILGIAGPLAPSAIRAQEPLTSPEPDSSATDTLLTASPTTASRAAARLALDAELSPDGQRVAFRAPENGAPRLFVRDVLDTLAAPRPLTPVGRSVGSYAWAPDGRHVVFTDEAGRRLAVVRLEDEGADEDEGAEGERAGGASEAAGVDRNAPLPAPSSSEIIADAGGRVRIAGFAPEPVAVLAEVPGRWPDAPDLVRIDLETGARTVVARNDGGVRRWIPDEAGTARLAVREDEDGGTELVRHRQGELVPVYRCGADEVCEPTGFHPDRRIWIRTSRDRDAPALVLLDPLTAEVEVVRPDLGTDTRAAFRDEAALVEATSAVRDVVGADAALTFHRPTYDGARWLVEARGSGSSEILLFDRWAGAVEPVLGLARPPSPSATTPAPDPSVLEPVRLAYRITEDEGVTPPVEMTRRIERGSEVGSAVWRVVDEARVPTYATPDMEALADMDLDALADDPDAVDEILADDPSFDPFAEPSAPTGRTDATDVVLLDGSTLAPVRRRAEGAMAIRLDFSDGGVSGLMGTEGFETPVDVATQGAVWPDGAALETLIATLPLAEGYRTRIPVLETETAAVDTVRITVTGTDEVTTPAGSFDVWRLRLESSAHPERQETWLVRRGSPHHLVRAEMRLDDLVRITELTDAGGPS